MRAQIWVQVPGPKGFDPVADAREKALQRTATRGVVKLFNAVTKAQREMQDAQVGGSGPSAKAAVVKLGKASFLAELKSLAAGAGGVGKGAVGEPAVPSQPSTGARKQQQQQQQQQQREASKQARQRRRDGDDSGSDSDGDGNAGWAVLQKDFLGLTGGNKMKDWDKQGNDDEEEGGGPSDMDSEDESD